MATKVKAKAKEEKAGTTEMAIAFAQLRNQHGLSKADLLRLLQRQPGLEQLNWTTYRGWASGATLPKPAYGLALRGALEAIRKDLARDGKDGKRK